MSEFNLESTSIPIGLSLIEAGAGTGKTWTLSHLLPRLLIQGRLQTLDQVVLVTFTDDAARELAERVRHCLISITALVEQDRDADPIQQSGLAILLKLWRALPEAERGSARRRLQNARDSSDRLLVSTIHSFCRRVLSDQGFLCGMPVGFGMCTDPSYLKEQALRDVWRADLGSDLLLAGLAANQTWNLQDDLDAWRLSEALDTLRLHPEPPSLNDAKKAIGGALEALKNCASDFDAIEEIFRNATFRQTLAAKPEMIGTWKKILQELDSQAPCSELWPVLQGLQGIEGWPNGQSGAGKTAKATLAGIQLLKVATELQLLLDGLRWAWTGHALRGASARLQTELRRGNLATYDDLINRLYTALKVKASGEELAGRLRSRWRVALVDESQDTDPRQWSIFSSIFLGPLALDQSLVLIGDPKQAIYGFRGADLQAYLRARDEIKDPDRKTTLTKTQRSAPSLVAGFNALWNRLAAPLASPDVLVPPASSARSDQELALPDDQRGRLVVATVDLAKQAEWAVADDRRDLAAAAAATAIVELLAYAVLPQDCVVLTRSNREALAAFEALRERGVAAVVRDDGDVLQSEEARDLVSVMAACLQAGRQSLRRNALATRLLGFDAGALLALTDAQEEEWQRLLAYWGELWRKRGIAALFQAAEISTADYCGFSLSLAQDTEGERRLTDLRHLMELLQSREAQELGGPERLLHWFESASAGGTEDTNQERLRRLDRDGNAVQILTMHRAKGLEFDYVFCPFLWSVHKGERKNDAPVLIRLPDQTRVLAALGQAQDAKDLRRLQRQEKMQEDLRVLYVALTRAKRRVWFLAGYIGYGSAQQAQEPTAVDWLLGKHVPGEYFEDWYVRVKNQKIQPKAGEEKLFTCDHLKVLATLQEKNPGIFSIEPVKIDAHRYQPPASRGIQTQVHAFPGGDMGAWRLTSFSRFTSGQETTKERLDPASDAVAESMVAEEPVGLATFPKGRHAGDALHLVLEQWNFADDPAQLIHAALEQHRLNQPMPAQVLPSDLLKMAMPPWADAIVPGLDARLGECAADKELSEWPFMLPLGRQGLSGWALSVVFAKHAQNEKDLAYAQRLQALAPDAVNGMLHGFIDRLAMHQGRWAVLDWKSNYLGDLPSHYNPQALWDCAAEHHYLLQVQLYLVALRRHLRQRDPVAAPVGAGLVFLRGLEAGTSRGLLMLAAKPEFLDDLEALFPWAVPA